MSYKYVFKIFNNSPKENDPGLIFCITKSNTLYSELTDKELNFEINGNPIKHTIKPNSIKIIPIALTLNDANKYNKLSNPIIINRENLNQNKIASDLNQNKIASDLNSDKEMGYPISLMSKDWLKARKFIEYQVDFNLKEKNIVNVEFNKNANLDSLMFLANIKYKDCNKPISITETTEVFNPDVNGLNHINMIRHKIIFNF